MLILHGILYMYFVEYRCTANSRERVFFLSVHSVVFESLRLSVFTFFIYARQIGSTKLIVPLKAAYLIYTIYTIFVSSQSYVPREPRTRKDPSNRRLYEHGISWYVFDTVRTLTWNLVRPKCELIPLGHNGRYAYLSTPKWGKISE